MFLTRSMEYFTSAAVIGLPSANLRSLRSLQAYRSLPLSENMQLCAASGTGSPLPLRGIAMSVCTVWRSTFQDPVS